MARFLRPTALLLGALFLGACAASPAPVADRGDRAAVSGSRYTVRAGDTLYSIAWRAGMSWKTLAALNGIQPPYAIYQGQVLQLRSGATARSASKPSRAAPPRVVAKQAPSRPRGAPLKGPLPWRWPVAGSVERPFANSGSALNKGVDLQAAPGAVVTVAAPGEVVYAGAGLRGFASLIIVKHDDTWLSAYAHNAEGLVREGARLAAGAQLVRLGRTEAARRLHFELRREGKPLDPASVLPKGGP
jgi:lipoprotein NlpD